MKSLREMMQRGAILSVSRYDQFLVTWDGKQAYTLWQRVEGWTKYRRIEDKVTDEGSSCIGLATDYADQWLEDVEEAM